MNGNLNNIRQSSIPLPITTAALRLAEKFSNIKGLSTAEKRDQVYFNTLASIGQFGMPPCEVWQVL
ncbi:MAG: hypothetical protein EAZ60_13145 [Oscillatoriales cyanobacterium]|nr:MAG: hypothetical protein EAZ60_13145 [Oscillatoriales cyanobacterium]